MGASPLLMLLPAVLALAIAAPPLAAQGDPADAPPTTAAQVPTGTILQFNPLGFLQFGPHFEAEFPIAEHRSVALGVRFLSLGLLPHLLTDSDETLHVGITVGGALHSFPQQRGGLQGLFVGPRIEAGFARSSDDINDYTTLMGIGAFDLGYRWIFPSGFTMAAGIQTGAGVSHWSGDYDGSSGVEALAFVMAMLTVGFTL